MISRGSSHRLPLWVLSVGVPALALILSVALSLRIQTPLLLVPFPLALLIAPGVAAGLGPASLRSSWRLDVVTAVAALLTTGAWYAFAACDTWLGGVFVILLLPAELVIGATVLIAVGRSVGTGIAYWRTAHWRALLPLVPLAVSAALIVVMAVLYTDNRTALEQRISDAGMIDNIQQHQSAFEEMKQACDNDPTVATLAPCRMGPLRTDSIGLLTGPTEEQCRKCRALLAETGVQYGERREGGEVYFEYYESGDLGQDWKGYVYSPLPLSPVANSLDDPIKPAYVETHFRSQTLYRRIADGWYLYRSVPFWDERFWD